MNKEYIPGVFRGEGGDKMVTHLYEGPYNSPGLPMCSRGWHRKYFDKKGKLIDWEYSIFRNNYTEKGVCAVCQRRANAGLPGITKPVSKYNSKNRNQHKL